MSNRISVLSGKVLPIATIVVTAVLFLLFMPAEPTALFWCNMCYTIFLEAVLFGWISLIRSNADGVSRWLGVILGTFSVYYVALGAVFMVGYSLLAVSGVCDFSWRIYLAVVLVLTLLWVIPAMFVAEGDAAHEAKQTKLEGGVGDLHALMAELQSIAERFNAATQNAQANEVSRLLLEVKSLPPARLQKPGTQQLLDAIADEFRSALAQGNINAAAVMANVNRIKNL